MAGFCAGLTLVLDSNGERKSMIAVTALSRLMDVGLRKADASETYKVPYKEVFLFVLGNLCTQWFLGTKREVLNKGVMKFYT